jgi:hypothetical protein
LTLADWMLWLLNQYELRSQFYLNLLLTLVALIGFWLLRH